MKVRRAIDLLHVACAVSFEAEVFLTFDQHQCDLAQAEGLQVFRVLAEG